MAGGRRTVCPPADQTANQDRVATATVKTSRREWQLTELAAMLIAKPMPLALGGHVVVTSFNAMAQSLVQLNAPLDKRGRVIGLFNMASLGLKTFNGISVGLLGSLIGIHWSLGLSAIAAMLVAGVLLVLP